MFGFAYVLGLSDEFCEVGVRDSVDIDVEGGDVHSPDRPLAIGGEADVVVGAHEKFPSRKQGLAPLARLSAGAA